MSRAGCCWCFSSLSLSGASIASRPTATRPAGRQSLLGILAAAVFCLMDSWLFPLYVKDFASYDQRYGSLGAVIVLLLWLYLAVFAILVGATP